MTSAAGHNMDRKFRNVLTAMIVVVLTAIYVVGIFLLWDYLNVNDTIDDILDHDFNGRDTSPASSTIVSVSVTGKTITDEEENLLSGFFQYFYAGLGACTPEKLTRFYTNQCEYELIDELAYDYETFLMKSSPLDLSFPECSLNLNVTRRHPVPRSQKIEIDLALSAQMTPVGTGRPSSVRGETHRFTLDESGKAPLILIHSADRPANRAADAALDALLAANRLTRKDLTYSYYPKYTETVRERLHSGAPALAAADGYSCPVPEYEYDRKSAATAARNGFDDDGIFKVYEENDANYISRCIFAGGIPMDSQGEKNDQWKWYDSEINTERKKTGCSKSWFDREAFYIYVKTNTGFGLVGCETSTGGGSVGDVVQLMIDDEPVEELMITSAVRTGDGTAADYLVSNDRYSSVSLLTLGFSDFRVLHIAGYNTANI